MRRVGRANQRRVSDAHVIMLVIKYLINLSWFKRSRAAATTTTATANGRTDGRAADGISARIHVTFRAGPYPPQSSGGHKHAMRAGQRHRRPS